MRQNIKDEVVAHNITASTSISLYLEKNYNELQRIALLLSQEPTCDLSHTTVFQGDPAIEDLRLVFRNNDGNYYYETDNGDTVNLLNSAYYSQGVFLHKQTANLINDNFTLAVPVYGESTEVSAALEGCFNSNSLANLLCGSARDCNICIVSQNCEIVCKSCNGIPDNLFDTLAVSVYDHNGSFIQIKDAIHDGVNGFSTEYSNSESEKSFISLEPIDGHTNWCTLAYTDITMSNTTYGKVLKTSGLVLGLSVLLLIVLILILYKFMARSIKKEKSELYEISLLTENIPCGVFSCLHNPSFTLMSISEGFMKMLCYSAEEIEKICNNSLWELIYQPDRIVFSQSVESQLQYASTIEIEFRLIKKDGTLLWVRNAGKMVRSNGKDTLYCVALDITEAKNYNDQLNSTSDDLKSIMDVIPGGLARISLSENFEITMANASFYYLCGYTPDDFRQYLNGGMYQIIDSRDRQKLLKNINMANVDGDPIITEFRITKKDGKCIWLSMHAQKSLVANDCYELLCVFTDISSLREAYNRAKADREKARTLAAMATDVIFEYDMNSDELQFTGNRLLDLPQTIKNISKRLSHRKFLPAESVPKVEKLLHSEIQQGKVETEELSICNSEGTIVRWYNIYAYTISDGVSPIMIGKLVDITDRKRELEALIEANKRDPLTRLYNTSTTKYYVNKFLEHLDPEDTHLHAFMVLDIDNFKNFNDVLGHATGDSVLTELSQKINNLFRSTDIVGRVGGDEFVLLIKDFVSLAQIKEKASEICNQFKNTYFGNKSQHLKLSVSIGIALAGKDGSDYKTLFEKADKALYKVKSAGKSNFALYSETE